MSDDERCSGPWVSGSGAHRVHGSACGMPPVVTDEPYAYCAHHVPPAIVLDLVRERTELTDRADQAERAAAHLTAQRDEARAERDAYKRAKEENDERFLRERDEARATIAELDELAACFDLEDLDPEGVYPAEVHRRYDAHRAAIARHHARQGCGS